MTVVSIIGKWITAAEVQEIPLTKSEHEGFMWQLALFDFQRLPETSCQALGDLISCIVLQSMSGAADRGFKDVDAAREKLFVSCFISSNSTVRARAMDILCARFISPSSDAVEATSSDLGAVLSQALQLDYEGVGARLWTMVIVDILLSSIRHDNLGVCIGWFATREKIRPYKGQLQFDHRVTADDDVYSKFADTVETERSDEHGGRRRYVEAVREIVQGDVDTCQAVLQGCFQAAWRSLRDNRTRASLINLLESLLAKPYHAQFVNTRQSSQMNAVQSMLRMLACLRPLPMVDPFLLQSLASNYNSSSEALALLERQYTASRRNGYDVDSPGNDMITAIQQCFELLGHRDVSLAISSATASHLGTKFALSLDLYDRVSEASDAYLSLIDRADGNHAEFSPTEHDMATWESRWVESQKELSQWTAIDDFATSTKDASLMLESGWVSVKTPVRYCFFCMAGTHQFRALRKRTTGKA